MRNAAARFSFQGKLQDEFQCMLQRILSMLLFLSLQSVPAFSHAHDCDWPFKTPVTITNSTGSTLTNYQTRVNINAATLQSGYIWSADGADLRVLDQDDTTELTFFVESWNAVSKTAIIWVTVPSMTAFATRNVFLVYGNERVSAGGSATLVFGNAGIKFHTKQSTVNPGSRAQAENSFAAASSPAGYGCKFITNFTGVNNAAQFGPPTRNSDIAYFSESWFPVTAAEEGTWSFRYGADFGNGGGLYVDDIALEEQWNDDLWWANNWNNAAEILEGSITLTEGYHSIRILGFEGCCDGGVTVQFRKPGGAYQTFSTANLDIRSRQCGASEPQVAFAAGSVCPTDMNVDKIIQAVSGVVNTVPTPGVDPGNVVTYEVTVASQGPGPSRNVLVEDELPEFTAFSINAYGGGVPFTCVSGCSAAQGQARLGAPQYSDDNGATWTYVLQSGAQGANAGYDAAVTHFRVPIENMIYGGEDIVLRYQVRVR